MGGIKTDYKYIIKYLEELVKEHDLKPQLICYDPHNASAFLSDLEALGFDSVSVTQTAKELNDATVDFTRTSRRKESTRLTLSSTHGKQQ